MESLNQCRDMAKVSIDSGSIKVEAIGKYVRQYIW